MSRRIAKPVGRVKDWIQSIMDSRGHARISSDFAAVLSGTFGMVRVRVLDISRGGVGLQSDKPLEAGTLVFFESLRHGLMGFSHVRHCRQDQGEYRLGLKFRDRLSQGHEIEPGWNYVTIDLDTYGSWDEADGS